jgi:hypothetical protein
MARPDRRVLMKPRPVHSRLPWLVRAGSRDTYLTQVISPDASDVSANLDETDDLDAGGRI